MSSNLNRKILLLIECPACLEHMKAPIFCCVKGNLFQIVFFRLLMRVLGHNICSDCCRRLKVCPHCRYPLTTSVRSYVLESIAEILQYPCYNSNAGCTDTLRLNHLEDHHAVCRYIRKTNRFSLYLFIFALFKTGFFSLTFEIFP